MSLSDMKGKTGLCGAKDTSIFVTQLSQRLESSIKKKIIKII